MPDIHAILFKDDDALMEPKVFDKRFIGGFSVRCVNSDGQAVCMGFFQYKETEFNPIDLGIYHSKNYVVLEAQNNVDLCNYLVACDDDFNESSVDGTFADNIFH